MATIIPFQDNMIGKSLRSFRLSQGEMFTLGHIHRKTKVPKGHISRIENNLVNPTTEMLIKILVYGFDMKPSKAKDLISEWRVKEALEIATNPKKVIDNVSVNGHSISKTITRP